jgi:hypothetical protein
VIHNTVAADIANTISKYTAKNPLIVYNFYPYYCELHILDDKYLFVDNAQDTVGAYILAYTINSETITLIIKHYAYRYNEVTDKPYSEITYFYVELKDVKGEIMCKWHEINDISLDGFTVNGAYIFDDFDDTVNIMLEPSLNSGIYATLYVNGEKVKYVKIIGIENRREKINDMYDFWYKIEYENKKLWMYGYYILLWDSISLE